MHKCQLWRQQLYGVLQMLNDIEREILGGGND
jgi:hypothetical protein